MGTIDYYVNDNGFQQYKIVAYEGKLKRMTNHILSPMIFRSSKGKLIPVSVDEGEKIIYIMMNNWLKYENEIKSVENIKLCLSTDFT